jgi:diaminopimelate epimerase
VSGIKSIDNVPSLDKYDNFDSLYEEYKRILLDQTKDIMNIVNSYSDHLFDFNPLSMLCGTFERCMKSGKDALRGGTKNGTGIGYGFIADIADSFAMLKKYVYDKKELTLSEFVEILDKNGFAMGGRVNMGKPIFNGRQIPTRYGDSIVKNKIINIENNDYEITCVNMGNPHCVVFHKDIHKLDLEKIGPLFENHEMFPERINTEFVEILNKNHFKMRVWERGSGETLACGTGACAVAVAGVLNGYCNQNDEIQIKAKGGELTVKWHKNNNVYLSGEAIEVFNGEI